MILFNAFYPIKLPVLLYQRSSHTYFKLRTPLFHKSFSQWSAASFTTGLGLDSVLIGFCFIFSSCVYFSVHAR